MQPMQSMIAASPWYGSYRRSLTGPCLSLAVGARDRRYGAYRLLIE